MKIKKSIFKIILSSLVATSAVALSTAASVSCFNLKDVVSKQNYNIRVVNNQLSFNKNKARLVLNIKNVNTQYVVVQLKANDNSLYSSNKARVVNNQTNAIFSNLDQNKQYSLNKILVYETKNSKQANEINNIVVELSNTSNPTTKTTQKQQSNQTESTNNLVSNVPTTTVNKQENYIRFAHWNVLNQGGTNDFKSEALAKIILANKIDVIALTEINAKKRSDKTKEKIEKPVADIVKLMNQYELDENKNKWSFRLSEDLSSAGNETQAERVAFIYDTTKLKPTNDGIYYKNNVNADILFDQHFKNKATNNQKIAYARPPFGLTFATLDDKFDFSMVASHLDSPGQPKEAYKQEEKQDFEYKQDPIKTEQGTRELNEAYQVAEVMKFVDQKDGANNDLFFLGDTNIKLNNEKAVFAKLINDGYTSLLTESKENRTSLGKNYNRWSQPYDKMFAKTDSKVINASKFNLWSVLFDQSIINEQWIRAALNYYYKKGKNQLTNNQIEQIIKSWSPTNEANHEYYAKVMNWISDHTLTFADLEIDVNDKTKEAERK